MKIRVVNASASVEWEIGGVLEGGCFSSCMAVEATFVGSCSAMSLVQSYLLSVSRSSGQAEI